MPGDRPEPVPLNDDLDMYFRAFKINDDIVFESVNCEAYTNLGIIAKSIMPSCCTAFCSVTFGSMGYISDAEGQWTNGFGHSNTNAWSGEIVNRVFRESYSELKKKLFPGH